MTDRSLAIICHGPPGSAPPVLAAALQAGLNELAQTGQDFGCIDKILPHHERPAVDAMQALRAAHGCNATIATCTPIYLQVPILQPSLADHRDLTPIARLVSDRFLVVCRASGPYKDAADFVAQIRQTPSKTAGYMTGGINQLLGLAIAQGAGAEVEYLNVGSEPEIWQALREGRIDWACGVAAEVLPLLEQGEIRLLAALDGTRLPRFRDIPTLAEVGVEVRFQLWRGVIAPPGLTPDQQALWIERLERITKTQSWQAYLAANGQTDAWASGADFAQFLEEEWQWYHTHLGLAGLL